MSNDKRTTIYLPRPLAERLQRFKGEVNVSEVAARALEVEVAALEEAEQSEAFNRGVVAAVRHFVAAVRHFKDMPLLVQSQNFAIPPDIEAELATEPAHIQEGFKAGWQDTVEVYLQRGRPLTAGPVVSR